MVTVTTTERAQPVERKATMRVHASKSLDTQNGGLINRDQELEEEELRTSPVDVVVALTQEQTSRKYQALIQLE